mmetsp:Transcript_9632/g.10662  ORF Transcript_9632/g.10662 Transcript_9632/m.10662 type:complete len:167 (-) Transcript_9632:119-619(-)
MGASLINLPSEIQLYIIDLDYEVYLQWPLLSKYTATNTRFDINMKKHGKWVKYINTPFFSKPQISKQQYWMYGKRHGECKSWYDNGQLEKQYYFVNGIREGDYKEWHENSQEALRCYYLNGKRDGDYKTWDNYGKVREYCKYEEDMVHVEYRTLGICLVLKEFCCM